MRFYSYEFYFCLQGFHMLWIVKFAWIKAQCSTSNNYKQDIFILMSTLQKELVNPLKNPF